MQLINYFFLIYDQNSITNELKILEKEINLFYFFL